MTSRALVLHGAQDLRLVTRPISAPAEDEVQVLVRATGLCGSDLHYFRHGRNGDFILREPLVLGHESIGEIIGVGSSVQDFKLGDRVALEVGLPCRKCLLCLQGRYNLCRSLRFRSSAAVYPHLDGTLMDVTNHPATMCHLLPSTVTDVQGALLEPLAVCLHAIHRCKAPTLAEVALAKSVAAAHGGGGADSETAALVFGAGAIGLLLAAALVLTQHFTFIVVADINAARLDIASSLSPCIKTFLIQPSTEELDEDSRDRKLAEDILGTLGLVNGFSRVFDCTGVPSCVRTGIYASVVGGVVVQVGMGGARLPSVPLSHAALREVDLLGVFRYNGRCYPAAIELASSPAFAAVAASVVTHTVELGEEDGQRAFRLAAAEKDEQGRTVVKVVVTNSSLSN